MHQCYQYHQLNRGHQEFCWFGGVYILAKKLIKRNIVTTPLEDELYEALKEAVDYIIFSSGKSQLTERLSNSLIKYVKECNTIVLSSEEWEHFLKIINDDSPPNEKLCEIFARTEKFKLKNPPKRK